MSDHAMGDQSMNDPARNETAAPATSPSGASPAEDTLRRIDDDLRLHLKPAGRQNGYVDGGWWPRSDDVVEEFTSLVAGLADRIGDIDRIGYPLATWHPTARRVVLGNRRVRLEGFRGLDPHVVRVFGRESGHFPLTILVVPPGTPEHDAIATLDLAATEGDTRDATTLLHDGTRAI